MPWVSFWDVMEVTDLIADPIVLETLPFWLKNYCFMTIMYKMYKRDFYIITANLEHDLTYTLNYFVRWKWTVFNLLRGHWLRNTTILTRETVNLRIYKKNRGNTFIHIRYSTHHTQINITWMHINIYYCSKHCKDLLVFNSDVVD